MIKLVLDYEYSKIFSFFLKNKYSLFGVSLCLNERGDTRCTGQCLQVRLPSFKKNILKLHLFTEDFRQSKQIEVVLFGFGVYFVGREPRVESSSPTFYSLPTMLRPPKLLWRILSPRQSILSVHLACCTMPPNIFTWQLQKLSQYQNTNNLCVFFLLDLTKTIKVNKLKVHTTIEHINSFEYDGCEKQLSGVTVQTIPSSQNYTPR